VVFGTCLIFVLATDLLKVSLAGKLRPKLTVKNLHFINRLSGLILIGFGVALCWGILSFGNKLK
jgi:threonine/homoserine/homoserine lactone efflux protein